MQNNNLDHPADLQLLVCWIAAGEAEAISGGIGMVTILVEKRNLGKTVIIIATIAMATEVVALVETEAVETGEIAKGKTCLFF